MAILAKLGYQVTAVTGKSEGNHALLAQLGAASILITGRMLLREKWAGVVDTVGGDILTTAIRITRYGGIVTCCGNVASPNLNISVYPFILRGVTLSGIDSASCALSLRQRIWNKLAAEWKINQLHDLARVVDLHHLNSEIDSILKGKIKGRIVVQL